MSNSNSSWLGRWISRFVLLLGTLVVLVILAPWIISNRPVRDWVLLLTQGRMQGSVELDDLSLSWWNPTSLGGLRLADEEHRPLAAIAEVDTDRSLGNLLLDRHNLGTIRINSPELHLVLTPDRNNVKEMFPHLVKPADPEERKDAAWNPTSARVEVNKLQITWCGAKDEKRWSVLDVSTAIQLVGGNRQENRPATFTVERTRVFDRFDVTPELCHDVLKFIAPPVAGALRTDGRVTLELDGARFPIGRPEQATLSGRLVIHSLDIAPGPVVQSILAAPVLNTISDRLGLAEGMALTREDLVEFRLDNGRFYHEGLELGSQNIRIRTRGSVGIDQSLDIVAEVHLRLSEETLAARPVLRALSAQPLVIPIHGTLQQPKIDAEVLGQSALGGALGALEALRDPNAPTGGLGQRLGGLIDALRQPPAPAPVPEPAPAPKPVPETPVPPPPAPGVKLAPETSSPVPGPTLGNPGQTPAPPAVGTAMPEKNALPDKIATPEAKPAISPPAPAPASPASTAGTTKPATPPATANDTAKPAAAEPAQAAPAGMALDILQELARRRRERKTGEPAVPAPAAPTPGTPAGSTAPSPAPGATSPATTAPAGANDVLPPPPPDARPARRLLNRAINRAINEINKPAEPAAGTPPPPAPAGTPAPAATTTPAATTSAPTPPPPAPGLPGEKPAPANP